MSDDDNQREGIDNGAAGGGDAEGGAVERERRPGRAAVPHAQRLLLPADRRRQLLRRQGSQGRTEQGAGAVLSDGRPAEAGRRRPYRD